jgi:predicted transcriptional regulator
MIYDVRFFATDVIPLQSRTGGQQLNRNMVKKMREQLLLSKTELARKAAVSPLTIDRVEKGMTCRVETKRKILLALGFDISEKTKVFPEL